MAGTGKCDHGEKLRKIQVFAKSMNIALSNAVKLRRKLEPQTAIPDATAFFISSVPDRIFLICNFLAVKHSDQQT